MRYNSYSQYFRSLFGGRMQKLSIDAGFSCPNRDGRLTTGGCTFCNNEAFTPSYLREDKEHNHMRVVKSITRQIEEGIEFHQWRYHQPLRYLAYFQAYSNTYAPLEILKQRYEEALRHPQVAGLVIGTRPDCVDEEKLDYLASLAREYYVAVEYGVESVYDTTLKTIHRGHDFACTEKAVRMTAERGLHCGGHFILGLPGETREMMLNSVQRINSMPLETVKFHQLQILKGSLMEKDITNIPPSFALEDYIQLVCDIVERLRPDLIVERFAGEVPPRYQADPNRSWRRDDGRLLRNEEIPTLVERELERRESHQGCKYQEIR
ncbi:MAG: TIGR01212 family radical SAM protein [Bacteroidales bacterium]|nr:TIGR01212 family radical SAM protein [Bacteroidales bacterium]